jgi:hypothetical protein
LSCPNEAGLEVCYQGPENVPSRLEIAPANPLTCNVDSAFRPCDQAIGKGCEE